MEAALTLAAICIGITTIWTLGYITGRVHAVGRERPWQVVEDGPPPPGTQIDRTPKPWWNRQPKEFWEN